MQLRDRTFLLLGGTGGIGRALIEPLTAAGARVIVGTRRPEADGGLPCPRVWIDLGSDQLEAELAAVSASYPDIDAVIHCAGQNLFAAIETLEADALRDLIAVNLTSALQLARHFVPRFREHERGALIFVGSTFGSIGFPGYTAYCASKFGLRGFTEALRRELADTALEVLYVAPRATRTAMNPDYVDALNEALGNRVDSPEWVAAEILRAMTRGAQRRYLGWPERFFIALNGLLPRLVDNAMVKQLPVIRRFLKSGVPQ